MNRIIGSYLQKFSDEHNLLGLGEAEKFERFVNFCLLMQVHPDNFEIEDVTTSSDDDSIDGAAALIDGVLVSTAESARSIFAELPKRRSAEVRYIFVQAKRSDKFDLGEMLKLSAGVANLFAPNTSSKDEVLAEFRDIHDVVVDNLSSVQDGRPECNLYYVCTGSWSDASGLRERALQPAEAQLQALGYFNKVSYQPVDRESLMSLWIKTRTPVQATFPVKGAVALPPINGVNEAYLALAPARDFIANVLADKDRRLKTAVFEQNVRAFLGEDNPVNARMRNALVDDGVHDRFAINNNGITIVSPDVRVQNDRISVSDYQIVNGCQTSHTLYRSWDAISEKVWLPVKIIEAEAADVVAQLVESTNSQTNIGETQFLSVKPFAQKS
ncbi:AIPR family protein [Burkholderia orbicola]|uniref:AIPR family protein n=1 Tax=Burkholderia orbicola TaxID=2978683 RepID=UPI002FE0C930